MASNVWNEEDIAVLKRLYPDTTNADIGKLLGRSAKGVASKAEGIGLKKSKNFKRRHGIGLMLKELDIARKEGRPYDGPISIEKLERVRRTQFKSGCTPYNKGLKWSDYMSELGANNSKATQFKKYHVPHNAKPIGYERLDKGGYVYIKVESDRRLVLKHRHIWEQTYGSIPKGFNVQFKDGNRQNCSIDNLYLISRRDQMLNENSMYAIYPEEIQHLIRLGGVLNRQINKNKKENNETD